MGWWTPACVKHCATSWKSVVSFGDLTTTLMRKVLISLFDGQETETQKLSTPQCLAQSDFEPRPTGLKICLGRGNVPTFSHLTLWGMELQLLVGRKARK